MNGLRTNKLPIPPSPGEEQHVRDELSYTEGDRVVISGTDRTGRCRFIGAVPFAKGIWAGIELPTADGKNDGSVEGIRYFTCKPKHGLFVRALTARKEAIVTSHINEDSRHTHLSSGTPIKGASANLLSPKPSQSSSLSTPSNRSTTNSSRRPSPISASKPTSGGSKSTSMFSTVFQTTDGPASPTRELDSEYLEQIVKSEVFKKAVGSLVSKQNNEIMELQKRIKTLENQNRELREGLDKQEKLRPSMLKTLEQHEEAWRIINRLSQSV